MCCAGASGFQNGKLRIFQHYQQAYPLQERAAFLKKEYGIGGGSHVFANGQKGNIWYDGKDYASAGTAAAPFPIRICAYPGARPPSGSGS